MTVSCRCQGSIRGFSRKSFDKDDENQAWFDDLLYLLDMGLPGESKPARFEPLEWPIPLEEPAPERAPERTPEHAPEEAPVEPAPAREPEPVPA